MILLTKLDNSKVLINLETIKLIESTPDTLLSFLNGDSLIVRESLDEINQRVINYRVSILKQTGLSDPHV